MIANPQYNYKNITGTTVVQVATGVGLLHTVTLNQFKNSGASVSIVDADANGTTAIIATITDDIAGSGAGVAIPATLIFDCIFSRGLKVISIGNNDITLTQSSQAF